MPRAVASPSSDTFNQTFVGWSTGCSTFRSGVPPSRIEIDVASGSDTIPRSGSSLASTCAPMRGESSHNVVGQPGWLRVKPSKK